MRIAVRVLLAAAAAAAYLLLTGFITVQAKGLMLGATIGWNGRLHIAANGPAVPTWHLVAVALLSATCVALVVRRLRHGSPAHYAEAGTVVAVLVATIAWGLTSWEFPDTSFVETLDTPVVSWLRAAAFSPAVHTVAALVIVVAIGQVARDRRPTVKDPASASTGAAEAV